MKILLDECVPRKLKRSLLGHECTSVPENGLAGKKNGELLSLAEQLEFKVLLTVDKGVG
jgi:predicted nuclease of predicted toxin-antitoxin system